MTQHFRPTRLAEIADPPEAAARAVNLALTAGTWRSIGQVAHYVRARLDPHDRARLAVLGMAAAEDEDAALLAEVFGDPDIGPPPPTFCDLMDEARTWAAWASARERRAFAAACVEAMDRADRRRFHDWRKRMQ